MGEEYPEVLGSILGALKAIVNVIGMTKMTPPIKDLLPRLTPILKNRLLEFVIRESKKLSCFLNFNQFTGTKRSKRIVLTWLVELLIEASFFKAK